MSEYKPSHRERRQTGIETLRDKAKQQFVEDLFDGSVEKERSFIPHAETSLMSGPKPANVKLSEIENLQREGWPAKFVRRVQIGHILPNIRGGIYEVKKIKKPLIMLKEIVEDDSHEPMTAVIEVRKRTIKAKEYTFKVSDSVGGHKQIKVFDMVYGDARLETTEKIVALVKALPAQHFNAVDELRLDRANFDQGMGGKAKVESTLASDKNVLTLYVDDDFSTEDAMMGTMFHELGHAIVKVVMRNKYAKPGKNWKKAMRLDGNSISEYSSEKRYEETGDEGEIEDVAEAVRLYLSTDGAKASKYRALREACSERFAILDRVFEKPENQRKYARKIGLGGLAQRLTLSSTQDRPLN